MAEQDIGAIWQAAQEFILATQRGDPTLRSWLLPGGDAALLLDIYGEAALLTLMREYREKEHVVLVRGSAGPGKGAVHRVEVAWTEGKKQPFTAEDVFTLQLRRVRRKWLVEDLWPGRMEKCPSLDMARAAAAELGERTEPALLFLAGALPLPEEGTGELDDVEMLFVAGMDAHSFSPLEVMRAVRMWRNYREQAQPVYRQPALYAAAIEYLICLLGFYSDTLKSIAEYYGVPARSIRERADAIRDCLQVVYFDPRYSALEGTAALKEDWTARGLPWPTPLDQRLGEDGSPQPH